MRMIMSVMGLDVFLTTATCEITVKFDVEILGL